MHSSINGVELGASWALPCSDTESRMLGAACIVLQERVEKAGGQVLYWNGHRVMGVLAMSRAIGDHCLRPYVIPEPEVRQPAWVGFSGRQTVSAAGVLWALGL